MTTRLIEGRILKTVERILKFCLNSIINYNNKKPIKSCSISQIGLLRRPRIAELVDLLGHQRHNSQQLEASLGRPGARHTGLRGNPVRRDQHVGANVREQVVLVTTREAHTGQSDRLLAQFARRRQLQHQQTGRQKANQSKPNRQDISSMQSGAFVRRHANRALQLRHEDQKL